MCEWAGLVTGSKKKTSKEQALEYWSEIYKLRQNWLCYNVRGETIKPLLSKSLNMSISDLQLAKWYKCAQRKYKARKAENLEQCTLDKVKFFVDIYIYVSIMLKSSRKLELPQKEGPEIRVTLCLHQIFIHTGLIKAQWHQWQH